MKVKEPSALKRARAKAGLTQRELAFLARCSHTTIYLLEKGEMVTLSDDLALRISKRLQRDVEDLFVERAALTVPVVASVQGDTRRGAA